MFSFKTNCKMYATIQVFYVRVWWQEIQTLGLKASRHQPCGEEERPRAEGVGTPHAAALRSDTRP